MTKSSDKNEDDKSNPNETFSTNENIQDDDSSDTSKKKWGYNLYPERKSNHHFTNWWRAFFLLEGHEAQNKLRCEKLVYKSIKMSPLVKTMMGALKSSGCEVDIRRHISCEFCSGKVSGGYDPELNQIVVCQNTAKSYGLVQAVLTHEMIHMFDYCRNDLDFKNIDHLACTEIRAANLTHCSFMSAMWTGRASYFNVKERHQYCVKDKAVASVMAVRPVTYEEALAAVNRVFPKCYPDLEPIGRRLRSGSNDMYKAHYEATLYGYV